MPGSVRQLDDRDAPVAARRSPPRQLSPARQRVVDVARQLFCSRGYERTPLREISDALGVTKAAIYHHFNAKDELLVAIVAPVLNRIDDVVSASPAGGSATPRRELLVAYLEALTSDTQVIALLLRDPAVGEHALGRRFGAQRARLRELLGAGDEPASHIRPATALGAMELAIVEFGDSEPAQLRETALDIAIAVLDSGRRPGTPG